MFMLFRTKSLRPSLITSAVAMCFVLSAASPALSAIRSHLALSTCSSPGNQPQTSESGSDEIYKVGGDVSLPELIHSVKPKFPKTARKERSLKAKVIVNIYVDKDGKPTNVHAVRVIYLVDNGPPTSSYPEQGVTSDLMSSSVEAVSRYKFKPAMKNGRPVKVELNVEVSFNIL